MRDAVLYGEKALNLDAWCVQDAKVREAVGERVQNRDAEHNDHIQNREHCFEDQETSIAWP